MGEGIGVGEGMSKKGPDASQEAMPEGGGSGGTCQPNSSHPPLPPHPPLFHTSRPYFVHAPIRIPSSLQPSSPSHFLHTSPLSSTHPVHTFLHTSPLLQPYAVQV